MIILGSTSEVAQAFVEKALTAGEKFPKIYLVTSSRETTERFAQHIDVKFLQPSEIIELDLTQEINYSVFENVDSVGSKIAAEGLKQMKQEFRRKKL